MAEVAGSRKITDLTEKTTLSDSDLLVEGTAGTDSMRKFTLSTLATWVKNKMSTVTYSLNCGTKSLVDAINEICQASGDQEYLCWECAILTSASKDLIFTSPTRRNLAFRTVGNTKLTALQVRKGGSYLVNESYVSTGLTDYSITVQAVAAGIRCTVNKISNGSSVAFDGATNNDLYYVYARFTVTWG